MLFIKTVVTSIYAYPIYLYNNNPWFEQLQFFSLFLLNSFGIL